MKRISALLLAIGVSLTGATFAADEDETATVERFRLVLTDGAVHEVRGPVERKGGMVLFRDERGRLASIGESFVREVLPVETPAAPSAPEAAQAPAPAPTPAPAPDEPSLRYGNTDLTPIPAPAPEPEVPPTPQSAAAPAAPAAPPSILPAPPTEVGGKPEDSWRGEIGRLRQEIHDLEEQEALAYRMWVCAMHDIPLDGGECRPAVDELPPVNRAPRTPSQRSTSAQLAETRAELQGKRDELAAFIDGAIAAGVPTGWLLAVIDEEAPVPDEAPESAEAAAPESQ